MPTITVLILDELPPPPAALLDALESVDAVLTRRTAARLLAGPATALPMADVLLAPARAEPAVVLDVVRRLRERGEAPVVVVHAVSDFEALEAHVRLGHEYLVPPFLPALVGARLRSCSERAELGRTLREADAHAELVSYERELEIGREIQAGFLPDSLPVPDGWEIDVRFRPARQVAGDFYDVFELVHRRRLALVVADVCDKGVGAALFMALIRSLLRHTAEHSGLQHLVAGGPSMARDAGRPGSRVPVVAIAAQIPSHEIGSGYFQETHPEHLFAQCSHYCELVSQPEQMPRVIEIAIQTAITKRGVSVVILAIYLDRLTAALGERASVNRKGSRSAGRRTRTAAQG